MTSGNETDGGTASAGLSTDSILARMDRIPVWTLPRSYLAIIGIGYFFTFFDIADIGYTMPAIAKQFRLTGSEALFVALAVGLVGYAVGSIVIGGISDRLGRYRVLIATLTITAIGSFLDATATGVVTLTIWRFVTGIGVGADLNLVSTYIGELAPARRRGRISTLTFLVGILGQAVTPFVALALVPNFSYGWRLMFVLGGLIATIGVVARFKLPESPRWLALHGRLDEADKVVRQMEQGAARRGIPLAEPQITEVSAEHHTFPYRALFARPYGTRLGVLVAMWFFWYIGNYAFLGDAASLLSAHGTSIADSILFLGIGAVGYPVGAIIMAVIADRVERRLLIFGSTIVWLAGMILIGSMASNAILTLGSFLASLALGLYLQVAYTYTAELFPTRARSSGFSLSDGIGHGGGAVGALLLPTVIGATSFFIGFLGIGITGLIAGLIALLGPRTSGRRLEDVSH
ncbi:MAG TPA: MFS transporter [Rhodanobacteraceae bacterium]|nr:MFS transporter [Rhodanobacteraceae bacterium]